MSYDHFRRCRAVRGHAQERKDLLAELKLEETMRDHFIIQTVAGRSAVTGKMYKSDPDLEARKATCAQHIVEIEKRLTEITTAPAPEPVVRTVIDSPRYPDGEYIMSRHLA